MSKLALFLTVVLAGWVITTSWVLIDAIVARMLGIRIMVYGINIGPALRKIKLRNGSEIRINAIPFGCYVRFIESAPDLRDKMPVPVTFGSEAPPLLFSQHPRWKRLIMVAASPAVTIAVAALVLGESAERIARGIIPWYAQMIWSPRQVGPQIVAGYFADVRAHDLVFGAAILAMAMAILNLIPLGFTRGDNILEAIVRPPGIHERSKLQMKFSCFGILAGVIMFISTWIAYISYLCNPELR